MTAIPVHALTASPRPVRLVAEYYTMLARLRTAARCADDAAECALNRIFAIGSGSPEPWSVPHVILAAVILRISDGASLEDAVAGMEHPAIVDYVMECLAARRVR